MNCDVVERSATLSIWAMAGAQFWWSSQARCLMLQALNSPLSIPEPGAEHYQLPGKMTEPPLNPKPQTLNPKPLPIAWVNVAITLPVPVP